MSTAARSSTATSSAAVPPAVRNWLKSQYRSAPIKDSWLAQTVASASGATTAPGLVQHVKQALLNTSLDKSLGHSVLPEGKGKAVIGDAILLEIVGKLDIGISAQAQLDVLEARNQARQTAGGAAQLEQDNAGNDHAAHEQTDHMADFNAAEEAASLPATVFPRSSTMQLTLSDGFATIKAFEHRRLPWLTMTEPPMGAKVVLKGAKVQGGHVLLTPECIELKGGRVEKFDNEWEEKMIDELRKKLGKPPRTKQFKSRDVNEAQEPKRAIQVADADEDEEAALFEAMQSGGASGSGSSNASKKRIKLPPKESAFTASKNAQEPTVQPPKSLPDRADVSTPSKPLHTPTESTTSPYFTSAPSTRKVKAPPTSSNKDGPEPLQADSDGFFNDAEDDFEMLLPNDVGNPIVLSDSE